VIISEINIGELVDRLFALSLCSFVLIFRVVLLED
jgi:hypothetical protein